MTTSTPPAWNWLHECHVPMATNLGYYPADVDEMCHEYGQMREEALSEDPRNRADSATLGTQNYSELPTGSRKTPESATLCERNGGDPTGEDVWPLERAARATAGSAVCADQCPEPPRFSRNPSGELERDQCDDCRCAPNMPHSPDCAGVRFGCETRTNLPVGAPNEHPADVKVVSCPECGAVTDIEYGPEFALLPKRESGAGEETFSVPFKTQEFMFEELAPAGAEYLHDLLNAHMDRIIEMARDRFRDGYKTHGSKMYNWTPERRLYETLCELADAVVYPTSGPIE